MRVALIKTGALGDVVRTTALVPGLRRLVPDLNLTWITAASALDLVQHHPDVAQAIAIDELGDALWCKEPYDWIISLDDGPEECHLASRLATAGGRISGAFEDVDGRRAYTEDVEPWFGMGMLRPEERGGLERANALKRVNSRTVAAILYDCLGLPAPAAGRASRCRRARRQRPRHGLLPSAWAGAGRW